MMYRNKEKTSYTYHRILETALRLFNEKGERNTSTNHIAQELGISPGNLYYHFSNKDTIIDKLFYSYSQSLTDYLDALNAPQNIDDLDTAIAGIYRIVCEFRFLFTDMSALLQRNEALSHEYHNFARQRIAPKLSNLLVMLNQVGLTSIPQEHMPDLAINMWMITKYWPDFSAVHASMFDNCSTYVGGRRQTLTMLRPYITPEHLAAYEDKLLQLATPA